MFKKHRQGVVKYTKVGFNEKTKHYVYMYYIYVYIYIYIYIYIHVLYIIYVIYDYLLS